MSAAGRFDAAFDWARRQVAQGRLPTAVLGIATADGTVALDAFEAGIDDRYLLFSVTKPLVGITAARAVARGLLTTQTPLTDALPGFGAGRDDTVLLEHLVSHTSGIAEPPLDTAAGLRHELISRGRDFAAGTASRYSTIAFEGVAALVEHATGEPWHTDLERWARQIGADTLSLDLGGAAPVVDAAENGFDAAAFSAQRNPGAGLAARAHDLLAAASELLRIGSAGAADATARASADAAADGPSGPGILSPATLAMMLRPLTGDIPRLDPYPRERGQDWGFTWNLRSRAPGLIDRDVYGHSGWAGTQLWIHPGAGVAWVLLTNRATRPGVDIDQLDNAIIAAL